MKVSRAWLQRYFTDELPSADVLAEALTFHAFEIEGIEEREGDQIIDVKVTPNRGHDALSHRALAAELGVALKQALQSDADPLRAKPKLAPQTPSVIVDGASPKVNRYIAGVIRGVRVGPSPEWLQKALESIGQRSINSVVDATNFVMFSMGQPLHAFDISKLMRRESAVVVTVRTAHEGETITALDEKTYTLTPEILVITDGVTSSPLGIAGIKGGINAQIDAQTTDILIEAANFDSVSVRTASHLLRLRTDASQRFEQGISPELAAYGMHMVVALIQEIAGGTVEGFTDYYPSPWVTHEVSISLERIAQVLGVSVSRDEVADIFTRLGFSATEENGVFTVTPSFERLDILGPEDLVEEVGRCIGYERVPVVSLPITTEKGSVNHYFSAAEAVRASHIAEGYSEVYTSVFQEAGDIAVKNKLGGDRPYLRNSLIPGLTAALAKNIPYKDLLNLAEIRLFEIGTVWKEGKEETYVGTISEKKGAAEYPLSPDIADTYADLPVSTASRFEQYSKYPYMVRDIALWVPMDIGDAHIASLIKENAGALLISLRLFDRFEKQGRISYAFRLIFQSFERTLTDGEVVESMERVHTALTKEGFEIR